MEHQEIPFEPHQEDPNTKKKKWKRFISWPLIGLCIVLLIIMYDVIIPESSLHFRKIDFPQELENEGLNESYVIQDILDQVQQLHDSASVKINQIFLTENNEITLPENEALKKKVLSKSSVSGDDSKLELSFLGIKFSYHNLVKFFRNKIGKKDIYVDIYFLRNESSFLANVTIDKQNSTGKLIKMFSVDIPDSEISLNTVSGLCKKISVLICQIYDPLAAILYDYNYVHDYENILSWQNNYNASTQERETELTRLINEKTDNVSGWSSLLLASIYEENGYASKDINLLNSALEYYTKGSAEIPQISRPALNNIAKINNFINLYIKGTKKIDHITRIIEKYENNFKYSKQLIIAYNEKADQNDGYLIALEKKDSRWTEFMPKTEINTGTKGFAKYNVKVEGDLRTPTGLYPITNVFGYTHDIQTKMPFLVLTPAHVWITDPVDINYNKIITEPPKSKHFEQLLRPDNLHKYGVIIDYNVAPVIPNKGSAITMHVQRRKGHGTAGCLSLPENKLVDLIEWLDPAKKPVIIMGNIHEL